MSNRAAALYLLAATLVLAGWWFAITLKFDAQDQKFDMIREDIRGVKQRQDNFTSALDHTYNLLQKHMRREHDPQENIPLEMAPRDENKQ